MAIRLLDLLHERPQPDDPSGNFRGYRKFEAIPLAETGWYLSVQNSLSHYCAGYPYDEFLVPFDHMYDFEIALRCPCHQTLAVEHPEIRQAVSDIASKDNGGDTVWGWVRTKDVERVLRELPAILAEENQRLSND